jgi:hypothetical protein
MGSQDRNEGTFVPKSFKTYNLTPEEQLELDKFLKENLEKGYIRPSQSPNGISILLCGKKRWKASTLPRLSIPERTHNQNAYPYHDHGTISTNSKAPNDFTKLDVRWGYNNVRIRDGRPMESGFQDQPRTLRTNSNVLWNVQFPSHIPSNDGRHL